MKLIVNSKLMLGIMLFLSLNHSKLCSQEELSKYTIDAYENDGWAYFGNNIFLYRQKENMKGNPQVLALSIDPVESTAMLYLNEYDCDNNRVMMLAYKRYQNKPYIEKEHYLFEHKREWRYPLKTSVSETILKAVCAKFGN